MNSETTKFGFEGNQIYTLAESGTSLQEKSVVFVAGNGSDIKNSELLWKRAKKKIITQKMALSLIDVAVSKNEPQRVNAYWNTYYCQNNVVSSTSKLYGKYCKNRFCTICLGIRKAELINKYLPIINNWKEPYFVTLTTKTFGRKSLKKMIEATLRAFDLIKNRCKKRHQRGKGIRLMGIKSLECNFNPTRRTYNPHLHIIVPNKETAELLISEWMKTWTGKYTNRKAQDYFKIENNQSALIEIIKYGSKIFTEPDINKKSKLKIPPHIYVSALDNILAEMKGHRIFDRFGFNLPKNKTTIEPTITKLKNFDEWEYSPQFADWVSVYSGELLTEYIPPFELMRLLKNNIDVRLE